MFFSKLASVISLVFFQNLPLGSLSNNVWRILSAIGVHPHHAKQYLKGFLRVDPPPSFGQCPKENIFFSIDVRSRIVVLRNHLVCTYILH